VTTIDILHRADSRVSVVIATLGGPSLQGTIVKLNQGSVVPAEVIVCIPEDESNRVQLITDENVRIVQTPCRGQVAQRVYGFRCARNDYVLQLDDDISVRENCLESLILAMGEARDVSVGPKLYNIATGGYYSFMVPRVGRSRFQKIIFWVINGSRGYQPGKIGRAGVGMGVPDEPGTWGDLEWLPGGCILHRRENLVLEDFYPFKGKAFVEDLFHSVILRRKKIRLMRCGSAICDVDLSSGEVHDFISFFKLYRSYVKAVERLIDEIGGSKRYLYLYIFLHISGLIIHKIDTVIRKCNR
jgi:glycosyltransferase involved in cell wall biosynthesis